jgi:hypothetical protein
VNGVWGYHRAYARAWLAVDTLAAAIVTTTATTFTVVDVGGADVYGFTPRISAGNLVKIDNEIMEVIATTIATNIVTVRRGVNGTTAAAHIIAAPVSTWQTDDNIRRATARQAGMLYARRGAYEQQTITDVGVITYPADCLNKNGGLIGKNAEIFRAMHDDKIVMKEREVDGIRSAVESVLAHPEIRDMLAASTHREHRFDAELLGVPCKCKPDIVGDLTRYVACYDLKFSLNIDPDSWRRTSKRLAYWLQTCHYSRVLEANFNKPVQFRFCNIEVKPPYRMMWYWYDLRSLEIASDEHKRLLLDLKQCQESGEWEDGWASECTISEYDIAAELSPDEVQIEES